MKRILLLFALTSSLAAQAQVVTVSVGTSGSALSPFNSTQANSVYEAIYKQTQLNLAGTITRVAFEKNSGAFQSPLTRTVIYMKHTTATVFTAGTLDTTGYQRVWAGAFTNNGTTGYQEVVLNTPFVYNNTGNLSLLVVRNGGSTGTTLWNYNFMGTNIARRNTSGAAISNTTALATSDALLNLRLTFGTASATRSAAALLADVYPNPATAACRVQLPNGQPASYQLTDMLGRTVRGTTRLLPAADGTATLPLADVPAGHYLLRLTQGAETAVQRLVRE
ncbi:T9SS type A sorting domain-containing protein [Hymenobacter sp. BT523]|uniref:T9SS type A sorting domain-containing protein n=1 Tax=Hymenobacter sp. BT523 TaxID=2795725 RepID=UPI0018EC6092|nr:T9SS type A sorting domain-containing protein [Hymenobacter sp. BT523]MBJ6109923.1 T9SS type A sorting domain-containing protein [Hymenobacter sp. BT523]